MTTSPTRRRLLALLRSPVGLRQTMLATEVLQPPVALRQRRSGRPEGPAMSGGRRDPGWSSSQRTGFATDDDQPEM